MVLNLFEERKTEEEEKEAGIPLAVIANLSKAKLMILILGSENADGRESGYESRVLLEGIFGHGHPTKVDASVTDR
jgi:hypothetical protein